MTERASPGSGKAWTGRRPRRRWAGKKTGKNPTDRGKLGVKRSVLIDGRGVPIGVAVAAANVHDQKLVKETLDNIPLPRPRPSRRKRQHLCLDKGYVGKPIERLARRRRYVPHVPAKDGSSPKKKHRNGKPRRWKVERTHSWLNRARRLLIRWEKKVANYLGFLHLQFAMVALRTMGVIG
jgi:putative transposase